MMPVNNKIRRAIVIPQEYVDLRLNAIKLKKEIEYLQKERASLKKGQKDDYLRLSCQIESCVNQLDQVHKALGKYS